MIILPCLETQGHQQVTQSNQFLWQYLYNIQGRVYLQFFPHLQRIFLYQEKWQNDQKLENKTHCEGSEATETDNSHCEKETEHTKYKE